jgi:hypothetical protein
MVVFIAAVIAATAGTVTGKTNSAELFGETFGVVLKVIVPLAMGISVLSILAMIVGMGYALAGPSKGWHVALLGMIVSVMHLGTAIIQGVLAIQLFIRSEFVIDAMSPLWKQAQPIFDLCGLITDIPLLSEHPARFMWRYNISVFGIVAGTLEFVRLVSISLLAQIYAEEGKAIETGHKALKSAYRAFWLLLLAGIFRVIAAYAFDWVRPDDSFMMFVGICTHGLITFSITMGLAMVLFFLAQTLEDVRDFVDPIRVASQGPIAEL